MSNELNTEILNQSNSCFIHAPATSENNQGNQLLNIDNTNFIPTGLAEEAEQEQDPEQDLEQDLEQEQQIARPILKRGVHINELLEDEEDEEEEDEDEAKEQCIEHDLEQQRPDLVWSEWVNRLITKKDFETFMGFVEPIVKSVVVIMEPVVKEPEPEKESEKKERVNLLQMLLLKYKKKAIKINEIIQRQMKEHASIKEASTKEATKEATKEEEEEEEEEEEDDFCESDHEDMREEYEKEEQEQEQEQEQDEKNECNTFTNFDHLSDCFETKEENQEEQIEEEQIEEEQMPPLEDHVCFKLQAELNQIQISFENPIWEEEYELNKDRIIKAHFQSNCNCCPPPPLPKKLARLF
jgi:hypothetical protein